MVFLNVFNCCTATEHMYTCIYPRHFGWLHSFKKICKDVTVYYISLTSPTCLNMRTLIRPLPPFPGSAAGAAALICKQMFHVWFDSFVSLICLVWPDFTCLYAHDIAKTPDIILHSLKLISIAYAWTKTCNFLSARRSICMDHDGQKSIRLIFSL